ncbi:hypothetical protein [uncultured Ruminococcus sp.]|uniref:hypothetical protein n=1 Tax=uncultured Ruminococcus sp. TaxID=165186 RepID=UPI00262B72B6|nr:hypothetical protein [uncultured Ruminococcus sp.]
MQNLEKRYSYHHHDRREMRRQFLTNLVILLLVLGLAAVCAVTYFHARGGFVR